MEKRPSDEQTPAQPPKRAKISKVKNKMPAAVQITAEQLLREAKERELEVTPKAPVQKISSLSELRDFQLRKRKDFEDNIRKNRMAMQNWIKYAQFEEKQGEVQRSRSVFERALDVDYRNVGLWLKYAEMEMRNKQINHARNLWDRAVTLMPRAGQFWTKYTYMEEFIGNVAGARQVFERWMEWQPEEQAWHAYINFELRHNELDAARVVYERFVLVHPEARNWSKYARFEERHAYIQSARQVFERAVEFYGTDNPQVSLLIDFARFEERQKEHERARVIYKYSLDNLPKEERKLIYAAYTLHEKKYGDKLAIEHVILNKRKFQYEEEILANPHNYDVWFDYVRLMEEEGSIEQAREVYERAVANVPPINEKRYWRRYLYLWINYALFEELSVCDVERTRQVYRFCLKLIPHRRFTFAKMWLYAAKFEIRQKALTDARKLLGNAIGMCPKDKLFRGYIELELQLREFDRCRKLYEKFLQFSPENCTTWMRYAELESLLGEAERARGIYDLAIARPLLDMPELLWKAYIDFEIELYEWENARQLYRRLLQRTQHVKVWISLANFEVGARNELTLDDLENDLKGQPVDASLDKQLIVDEHNEREADKAVRRARQVYVEANDALRLCDDKEQRVRLLQSWKEAEDEYGDEASQATVLSLQPQKVIRSRRRRRADDDSAVGEDDAASTGWEEFVDYVFPADLDAEAGQPNRRLLAVAARWAERKQDSDDDDDEEGSSDEDEEEVAEGGAGKKRQAGAIAARWNDGEASDSDGVGGDADDLSVLDERPSKSRDELALPDDDSDSE